MNVRPAIRWNQMRALVSAGVRMDFRGYKAGSKMSPLIKTVIVYSVMGGSMAAGLIQNTSPFLYTVLVFGYSMLMTALAALHECSNGMFNPEDADVLSFRPVSTATVLAAKTAGLLLFTLLAGFALCLIPSGIGLALPQTAWNFPFVFLAMSAVANLSAALFVAGWYPRLEERLTTERFKDALVYVQVGATFVIFLLLQLYSRAAMLPPYPDAAASPVWFRLLPPVWFASGLSFISGAKNSTDLGLFLLGLASTAVLGILAFRSMARHYQQSAEPPSVSGKRNREAEGKRTPVLLEKWLGHPERRAGYALVSHLMKRDRSVKMGVYPLLGIPLAYLIFQWMDKGVQDPYSSEWKGISGGLPSVVVGLVFFATYTLLFSLLHSRDWESAWIFHVSPIRSPGKFYSGVKMYVSARILFPFFVLYGIVYCMQIPVVHAVKHVFFLFFFSLGALAAASFFIRDYPFSKKMERGMRARGFLFLAAAIPLLAMFSWMHRLVRLNGWLWSGFCIGWLALVLALEKLSEKRLDRLLKKKEYRS